MGFAVIGLAALGFVLAPRASAQKSPAAEKCNMELVGYERSPGTQRLPAARAQAGRPLHRLHRPSRRLAAQPAHRQAGRQRHVDPRRHRSEAAEVPRAHSRRAAGQAEAGGAQMVRVCDGSALPRADKSKVYLLRSFGGIGARNLGRHRSGEAEPADRGRQRTARHAQELVGMRHRDRLPRLRRARLAHAPHDADLRLERSGEAGVHPQLRPAGPAAGLDRAGADRTARRRFPPGPRATASTSATAPAATASCRSSIGTSC